MSIDGFDAVLERVVVGADAVALWRVAELERHVDRHALLAGDDPHEPPYWAHLWTGAAALAAAVPPHAGAVLEMGCGLGLPGLVAARRGATVTFVDRIPTALGFVRASVRANRLADARLVAGDLTALPFDARFDVILAAEILYDRGAFPGIAKSIARSLAPHGRALLSDAHRTDTSTFYDVLAAAGLRWSAEEQAYREEGLPVRVHLVELRHA